MSVQNELNIWTKTASNPYNGNPKVLAFFVGFFFSSVKKKGKTGVVDYCAKEGLVFFAYSPLGGLKTRRNERNLVADFPKFGTEAAKRGVDP